MSEEKALTPIDQRTVDFYGDPITTVLVQVDDQEQVFVPIRPICEFLGVAWQAQLRRIRRDPVLSDVATSVTVTVTEAGQRGEMVCLPLDYLQGWLFGISAQRVKEELRERVIQYQRECYRILASAFLDRPTTAVTPQTAALLQIKEVVNQVIDSVIALERRQASTEERLNQAAQFVGQMNKRLTHHASATEEPALRLVLSPRRKGCPSPFTLYVSRFTFYVLRSIIPSPCANSSYSG